MNTRRYAIGAALATGVVAAVGCYQEIDDLGQDYSEMTSEVTERDWLEGAYVKQGGTKLNAVFRRNEESSTSGTYFGEIVVEGVPQRAEGTVKITRDNLGTVLVMELGKTSTSTRDGGVRDSAAGDAGPNDAGTGATAPSTLVKQAFSGRVHFLKIGKNDTILVRADATEKTAHYKKVGTWCAPDRDSDCAEVKQRTGLSCDERVCTAKQTCACAEE